MCKVKSKFGAGRLREEDKALEVLKKALRRRDMKKAEIAAVQYASYHPALKEQSCHESGWDVRVVKEDDGSYTVTFSKPVKKWRKPLFNRRH